MAPKPPSDDQFGPFAKGRSLTVPTLQEQLRVVADPPIFMTRRRGLPLGRADVIEAPS